ncbi:hypothetical protein MXD81_41975 [Microbacteriaceae bacterium K1510]|nr:hypothetical protein [Microbacteriaceae bacterium K1510]
MTHLLLALAGLMGACGVVLAAAGAHGKPGAGLDSAGYLLLLHAAAVVAAATAARAGLLVRPIALVTLCGFVIGAGLFAADVAARAYLGHRLFPMAAPTGGTILILSWLVLTAAALAALRSS